MKKWNLRKYAWPVCLSGILAAELVLLADMLVVFLGGATPLKAAVPLWLLLAAGVGALLRWKTKWLKRVICSIPLAVVILAGTAVGLWYTFSAGADYEFPDAGKHQIFGERRVMLIVPHQDDELNVLGGTIEEYTRYGSPLYLVFVTNGDYEVSAATRMREALAAARQMGVPEEQVIFLGYGDDWAEGPHIYNAAPGAVMTSFGGRTRTYGMASHPVYRENRDYTIENLTEDLRSVILEIRPDVIFCSDYDAHIDHKAVSMLFEKVMGGILKEEPDYRPVVYKAYAYGTAWEAEPDYYADNILSTRNPFAEPYSQQPVVYHWEDRVRFPVQGSSLSRSLLGSRGYGIMKLHRSQRAERKASAVLNGDKVAWRRYTDSLCLGAAVTVSSGDGGVLNDFMLLENRDLRDRERMPYDGVWMPSDEEKMVTVTLTEPSDIAVLALYDHPDPESNVLNAIITFDDGTSLETGPLDPGGAVTWVAAGTESVSSFTVKLLETEGEEAGLSELEAFAQAPRADGRFLKLTDRDGNFLYDCMTAPDGTAELSLYTYGDLPEWNGENYFINTDGGGTAVAENGVIRVTCPEGEKFILHVACNEAGVSDNIVIRNPGRLERFWDGLWQAAEERFSDWKRNSGEDKLLIPYTIRKIGNLLRRW